MSSKTYKFNELSDSVRNKLLSLEISKIKSENPRIDQMVFEDISDNLCIYGIETSGKGAGIDHIIELDRSQNGVSVFGKLDLRLLIERLPTSEPVLALNKAYKLKGVEVSLIQTTEHKDKVNGFKARVDLVSGDEPCDFLLGHCSVLESLIETFVKSACNDVANKAFMVLVKHTYDDAVKRLDKKVFAADGSVIKESAEVA